MVILEKGHIYKEWKGIAEGPHFDYIDGVAGIYIHVHSDILMECEIDKPYELSLVSFENTIFICFRWGLHDFISMPYNPHLSKYYVSKKFDEGTGLQVVIYLINVDTGELVDMAYIVLSAEFSNKFIEICDEMIKRGINVKLHNAEIERVYRTYKTDKELSEKGIKFSIR